MLILVTLSIGLVWWVAAWSFGIKAFDAFLLTVALVVAAAAITLLKPYVNQLLRREPAPIEERGKAL